MNQGPKLYTNKPKRAKLKQSLPHLPLTMTSSSTSSGGIGSVPEPPQPVKESFFRRYKFLWPVLLAVNLSIGGYLYTKTRKKDVGHEETELHNASSHPSSTSTTTEVAVDVTPTVVQVQPIPREPISEDHQRELFKWILEEKRKVKPRDAEEKKRIDEEKAILKKFIRGKSIPST